MKMKKGKFGKILLTLTVALLLALSAAGCGTESAKTMLALNQELTALTVTEAAGTMTIDFNLSDELASVMPPEVNQLLDFFKEMSYTSKGDSVNLTADASILANGSEFFRMIMDGPSNAYYIDATGMIDLVSQIDSETGEMMAEDLQGNQWLKFDFDFSSLNYAESLVAYELLAEYMLGLENEVFQNFDSGLVKNVSGGFEFRVTYEQLGPYIQSIGAYALEHLDAFAAYTKTFLQGLSEEEMTSLALSADMRDEMIADLDELAAPENKPLYENYLAGAVTALQMPDVAKIFGGSYWVIKMTKNGNTFVSDFDFLLNCNFVDTGLGAMFGMDLGNNSLRFAFHDETKPLASFTPELPTSSIINAEDTENFAGAGLDSILPYSGLGGYGYGY
ncbi:MAG: hypothetical protein LBH21_08710 [Gracilibacteraceae bacterium]|jgi:hypothetical protein|nr:hypothetical protein [Gracilibacteraceae bacterium]